MSGKSSKAVVCPICEGSSTPYFRTGEHQMYNCGRCATRFMHPLPPASQIREFYSRYHLTNDEGGVYDKIDIRMQADFPAKLQLVKDACGGNRRILDVGCGKGFFVKLCRDSGFDAMGIDLSDSGIRYATETLKVPAQCGALSQLKSDLGQFDVVTFWATIEHLLDPVEMLNDLQSVLKPKGILLMDTGIGGDFLDRTLPGVNQWYDPPEHLFVFSVDGIRAALEKTGFEVMKVDRTFERSLARRILRFARNNVLATVLKVLFSVGGLSPREVRTVKFPMGNLMSITARRH